MTPLVFTAVLIAAALHASWNALVKNSEDKYFSMTAVVLGHFPFACAAAMYAPLPDSSSWSLILAGAALHVGYQLFLLQAYRTGDLSPFIQLLVELRRCWLLLFLSFSWVFN